MLQFIVNLMLLSVSEIEKEKKKEKVETAVLSITNKHRRKDLDKKKLAAEPEKMDVYVISF